MGRQRVSELHSRVQGSEPDSWDEMLWLGLVLFSPKPRCEVLWFLSELQEVLGKNAHSCLIITRWAHTLHHYPHNRSSLQQGRAETDARRVPASFLLFTIRIQLKPKSPACVHCPLTRRIPNSWFALLSRDSGFGDVSLSDEEVIDFPGFVHVYLDECSCLCQSQASLLVTLIQQSGFIF